MKANVELEEYRYLVSRKPIRIVLKTRVGKFVRVRRLDNTRSICLVLPGRRLLTVL